MFTFTAFSNDILNHIKSSSNNKGAKTKKHFMIQMCSMTWTHLQFNEDQISITGNLDLFSRFTQQYFTLHTTAYHAVINQTDVHLYYLIVNNLQEFIHASVVPYRM